MAENNQQTRSVPIETQEKLRAHTNSVWRSVLKKLPVKMFAVGVIYATGYWRYSPIWFIVVWGLFQYRAQKKHVHNFTLEVRKAIAIRDERKLILSNVDPPPSWVYFTRADRCECVNKIAGHLWHLFQPYVIGNLKNIEPLVNNLLSKYKKNPNFSFKKTSLGSSTPRVTGVKVYDNNNTGHFDRTIIDIYVFFVSDFAFYCSLMKGINFGCKEFEIKGCIRAIVSRSETSPFPGLEIFFVDQPLVDFNLTGLLDVGDLPGLEGVIRNTINGVIAKKLVLPNKLVINYDTRIDSNQLIFPDPQGLLSINAIKAKSLGVERFLFFGSKIPDPYVTITMASKTFTSPSAKNTTDPVWNYSADFIVDSFLDDTVTISVFNEAERPRTFKDHFLTDLTISVPFYHKVIKNLGNLSLSVKLVDGEMDFHSWIQLEGVPTGMIDVRVSYHKLENNPELLASNDMPVILEVLIDDAKNLPNIKDKLFAEISVGNVKHSSKHVSIDHRRGVFREVFSFPVKNPRTDKLRIKLINEDDSKNIGITEFDIRQLLEANNLEVINKQSKLRGPNDSSRLSVSMRLRTLKH